MMINENPGLGIPIDDRLPYTKAELIWICKNEMPVNIEDLLARRTRALFLNAHASADIASEAALLMAKEFGYDIKWQKEQVESYNQLVRNYI
jgi:glycerol-3-phosphate dehydrogenase